MGARRAALACLLVAACAAQPAPPGPSPAAQVAACDRAVAAHVGLPPQAVASVWRETSAQGVAVVEARDGARLHVCQVDAAGIVLRLDHPRE